ncbi:MAG: hypothetical protein AAF985_05045 [Bacteroidota bacterium]
MRNWILVSCLFCLWCIAACTLNKKEQAFYYEAALSESFRIQNGRDTTLYTAEGFQITIAKTTFQTD